MRKKSSSKPPIESTASRRTSRQAPPRNSAVRTDSWSKPAPKNALSSLDRGASLRRKKYSVAIRHGVGYPRTDRCSVPSGFRSFGPTTPASGCASAKATSCSSASPVSQASGFNRRKYRPDPRRMPALLPAPKPRFSCSTSRASGNRSRTSSTVPSVEPLSTTISSASVPRKLSSERSTQGAALYATTIAVTSAIGFARHAGASGPPQSLPREDQRARRRHHHRDDEEEEPGCEGPIGIDADATEEADEERLPYREPVDGEGDEHDEEEQRAHHVVRPWREVDPNRLAAEPDREHAHRLHSKRDRDHSEQDADVLPVGMESRVDLGDDPVEPQWGEHAPADCKQRAHAAGEEEETQDDRRHHEDPFHPEIGADVVVADGEHEPEGGEHQGRRAADRPLEEHGGGGRVPPPGVAARGLVDADGIASDRGREHLARGVGDEIGARQPGHPVVDALGAQEQLPAPRHRQDRHDHQHECEQEIAEIGLLQHVPGTREVDLPEDVGRAEPGDEERQRDADRASHRFREEWTCCRAAITSAMSSSEWAGESGNESTSSPARSATGRAGWSG